MGLEQTIRVTEKLMTDLAGLNDTLMGLKGDIKTGQGQRIVRQLIETATELDDYITAYGVDERGLPL